MMKRTLTACLLLVWAAGCGTPSPPDSGAEDPASDGTRADAILGDGVAVFDCDGLIISAVSEDDGVRVGLPDRTLLLPHAPARRDDREDAFVVSGSEAALTLDGRTYACRQLRDPWHEARQRGVDFRAVGQEPGWYLEIRQGETIHLVYDYGAEEATAPAPPPETANERTTFTTRAGEQALEVSIDARLCQDGMSGQPFSHTVTVTLDGRVLDGCGRPLGPRPDGWTATARGVGPVRIGMTRAQADAALPSPLDGPASGECVYLESPDLPAGVRVMQVNGIIVRVDVTEPGVPTDAGVEVGGFERHVHLANGPGVMVGPHKYTDGRYLTVASGEHAIVFETDNEWITRYRVGRLPEVEWVEGCS